MASILKPKSRKQLIEDFCTSNKVYSNDLKRLMTMYRWWHRGMFVWIFSILQLILGVSIVVNNIISQTKGYFWYPVKWGEFTQIINIFWVISAYTVGVVIFILAIKRLTDFHEEN